MSTLVIRGLRAGIEGAEILKGINLEVSSGEVHAVMGPNGSGKSTLAHVLAGHPRYEILDGTIELDGVDLTGLATWERARAGLFLAQQYPTEVPGVDLADMMAEALAEPGSAPTAESRTQVAEALAAEASSIGFDTDLLTRPVNVDLSGGEKKRNETLQLSVLKPRIAILDELDSGLDVDALRAVSRRIEGATNDDQLGVLAITHYKRLLTELHPDHVHVLAEGIIQKSGGPELADELEASGYAEFATEEPKAAAADDPFADPFA